MNSNGKLLYIAFGGSMPLFGVIVILIISTITGSPSLELIYHGPHRITCERLTIWDKHQIGVESRADGDGGTISIHAKDGAVDSSIFIDAGRDHGQIWIHGKSDDGELTSINDDGRLLLHSKEGATVISSNRLSFSDEKGDITLRLPEVKE